MVDAVVVGAGPNGLVAANLLADEGWDVLVLEAQPDPGGAVRSAHLTGRPDFVHDRFSAFYPLAAASPVIRDLGLDAFGLRWRNAPLVVAHPTEDSCPILSTDLDETADGLDRLVAGDGRRWRDLYRLWERLEEPLIEALLGAFPPVSAGAKLAARLGRQDLLRFARFALLPVRRLAEESFRGPAGGLLLAGNALHTDLSPDSVLSGFFGWLLMCLGQQHGFPVPEGGAGQLTSALVRRLQSRGGEVRCGTPVSRVLVRKGRAVGVRTASGDEIGARRAVVADVIAPALYLDLVGPEHLPSDLLEDLARFQLDNGTVKVDWALSGPLPWKQERAGEAGTVHLGPSIDHLTETTAQLSMGLVPAKPYLVIGQMTTADPTRSPEGTETLWAYTHVPQRVRGDALDQLTGRWDAAEADAFADRIEAEIEAYAPGFRDVVLDRVVLAPPGFEEANANLVGGALNGGTAQLYQQLVFRPTPGLARPETPVRGLFLGSSSAHPGGGVHGACGANAARAALGAIRRRTFGLGAAVAGAAAAALPAARLAAGRRR